MLTRKVLETMLMYEVSQAIKHVGEKGHWHAGRQKLLESLLVLWDKGQTMTGPLGALSAACIEWANDLPAQNKGEIANTTGRV